MTQQSFNYFVASLPYSTRNTYCNVSILKSALDSYAIPFDICNKLKNVNRRTEQHLNKQIHPTSNIYDLTDYK